MNLRSAIQLAWSNATDDWQRLWVRCAGIAFAVVLMFMETGFRNALFDSNVRVMQTKITADIVIRSASRYMFSSRQLLPLSNVIAARSCAGVRSADPLYLENSVSEIRSSGHFSRRVRVLAFDPVSEVFANFGLSGVAVQLAENGTAAADRKSKACFGFPRRLADLTDHQHYELAGRHVRLVGLFENGIDFSNDGNLVMTPRNFADYFPMRGNGDPLGFVDYGVIDCDEGCPAPLVISRLRKLLGPHVTVQTREAFLQSDRDFWSSNTPIGLVFWVGTLIGFIVGMSICYQVLATDIADHLSEFSTLKAMGYSPWFFASTVIVEALLLSLVSFLPGFLIAMIAFHVTNYGTGLFLFLNFERTMLVLGLTVLMCVFSGIVALRKLLAADPASLF